MFLPEYQDILLLVRLFGHDVVIPGGKASNEDTAVRVGYKRFIVNEGRAADIYRRSLDRRPVFPRYTRRVDGHEREGILPVWRARFVPFTGAEKKNRS